MTTWTPEEVRGWFAGRLPDDWFTGPPTVTVDREELLVVGVLPPPDVGEGGDAALAVALAARIKGFREETRRTRMRVADEAETLWGRKVSWGATCGDRTELFRPVFRLGAEEIFQVVR